MTSRVPVQAVGAHLLHQQTVAGIPARASSSGHARAQTTAAQAIGPDKERNDIGATAQEAAE
eukprot:1881019-Alexandrium_andersonii.AAC.1